MSTKLAQEEELLAALKTVRWWLVGYMCSCCFLPCVPCLDLLLHCQVEAENEELEGKLRQYHARAVAVQSALQDKLATTTAVSAAADAAASTS